MKGGCGSSFDRFSELPSSIIQIILKFLPLRDVVRTSILSRTWRFQWAKVPQLVFDDNTEFISRENPRDIFNKIFAILLLHHGPIFKFTLDMTIWKSCSEIDKIIPFLSRNGIQELTLLLTKDGGHKLPSSIFFCLRLKHLTLSSCVFQPSTFKGFDMLMSLKLVDVKLAPAVSISNCPLLERLTLESLTKIGNFSIDAPKLKKFYFKGTITYISFINAPTLAVLSLSGDEKAFFGTSNFDLIKVFGCLPLIENLQMFYRFLELLAADNVPKKLPTVLNHLKYLELTHISFTEMDEFPSAICLIRSSPNLQKLKLKVTYGSNRNVEPALEYLGMQDYSDMSLNKLCEVQIEGFIGLKPELEFIKFLLAFSPELETLRIKPASRDIIKNGYKLLLKLTRFRRASQKAEIIFPGLDDDQA